MKSYTDIKSCKEAVEEFLFDAHIEIVETKVENKKVVFTIKSAGSGCKLKLRLPV
jgi:hypothetical protein